MTQFTKKPVTVEAITFDELVEYGKANGANIVEGMPWSFEYNGHRVTHESDECYIITTLEGDMRMSPSDMLITGVQGEIYQCKIDIFEATYQGAKTTGLSFGEALDAVKAGKLVAREGWNGKNMFIFLVPGSHFTVSRPPLNVIFPEGTEIDYHGHVDMRTATGEIVPWLCSQTDMLADDWTIVS